MIDATTVSYAAVKLLKPLPRLTGVGNALNRPHEEALQSRTTNMCNDGITEQLLLRLPAGQDATASTSDSTSFYEQRLTIVASNPACQWLESVTHHRATLADLSTGALAHPTISKRSAKGAQ
jgi:hypothetical protein